MWTMDSQKTAHIHCSHSHFHNFLWNQQGCSTLINTETSIHIAQEYSVMITHKFTNFSEKIIWN